LLLEVAMSLQMERVWMVLAAGMLGAGCVPLAPVVAYNPMNASPRPLVRRPVESVELYASSPPTRPHVDVGLFEVSEPSGPGVQPSWGQMTVALRAHGALLGCDAVSVVGFDRDGRHAHKAVRAICVVYTDDQAIKAAAARPLAPPIPGEGAICRLAANGGPSEEEMFPCSPPLVCKDGLCVSPYDRPARPL
jgi:hypothetical protein